MASTKVLIVSDRSVCADVDNVVGPTAGQRVRLLEICNRKLLTRFEAGAGNRSRVGGGEVLNLGRVSTEGYHKVKRQTFGGSNGSKDSLSRI